MDEEPLLQLGILNGRQRGATGVGLRTRSILASGPCGPAGAAAAGT
jgi:hypothetical protein